VIGGEAVAAFPQAIKESLRGQEGCFRLLDEGETLGVEKRGGERTSLATQRNVSIRARARAQAKGASSQGGESKDSKGTSRKQLRVIREAIFSKHRST